MSCTIFYKGMLREKYTPNDVFDITAKRVQNMNIELTQSEKFITLNFLQGQSEPLVFHFEEGKIDGFCKWDGENPAEFYSIFDLFIDLKPLFKSLIIEDDEGLWYEYVIQKQPCKINLRTLSSPNETKLLARIKANERCPTNEIEQYIIDKTKLFLLMGHF